jgi:hypothetical protein
LCLFACGVAGSRIHDKQEYDSYLNELIRYSGLHRDLEHQRMPRFFQASGLNQQAIMRSVVHRIYPMPNVQACRAVLQHQGLFSVQIEQVSCLSRLPCPNSQAIELAFSKLPLTWAANDGVHYTASHFFVVCSPNTWTKTMHLLPASCAAPLLRRG